MKTTFLLFSIVFLAVSVSGEESRLEKLRSQKDAAIARAEKPINEGYLTKLEELLQVLTAAGELELALEVKEARKDVESGDSVSSPNTELERLALLQEQRRDALERARAPIEATYLAELRKMQRAATSSGNLEEAVQIKNELALMEGKTETIGSGGDENDFSESSLIGTEWELEQGGEKVLFRFGDGRFQVHKQDAAGEWVPGDYRNWKMENPKRRQIRIFWHYGEEVATVNSRMTTMKDAKHVLRRVEE